MVKYIDVESVTGEIEKIKKKAVFENSEFMKGYIAGLFAIEILIAQLPIVEIKEERSVFKNDKMPMLRPKVQTEP